MTDFEKLFNDNNGFIFKYLIKLTNDIEELFIQNELSEKAMTCLHQSEEPYKEVFMLSVLGGLTLKDISKIFGKSESWARVTFYRAKKSCQKE